MTERLLNLKTLLVVLVMVFAAESSPVQAGLQDSYCDAGGNISINNINIKSNDAETGTVLQTVTSGFSYTCFLFNQIDGVAYQPTLRIDTSLRDLVNALKNAGLGINLTVTGDGSSATYTWQEILDAVNSGGYKGKVFGSVMHNDPKERPDIFPLTGKMTMDIFLNEKKTTFVSYFFPSLPIFYIQPYNVQSRPPSVQGKRFSLSSFNVRFIPDNAGKVSVTPSVVRMGHFYTGDVSSQTKQASFTVTAQQNTGTGLNPPFVVPLAIEFRTNGLALTDTDRAVVLNNTDGSPNGLKLAVKDENDVPVNFNKAVNMGNMTLGSAPTGSITKRYTATVEPIPQQPVKTGDFSAAMSVIVTYQ
ncbi:TPA: fimbrial protein [Salmonella enterica subsp. enterica serovar Java]